MEILRLAELLAAPRQLLSAGLSHPSDAWISPDLAADMGPLSVFEWLPWLQHPGATATKAN